MPLNRPSLNQIIKRVRADIRAELGIATILRRTFLGVFSRALAGQSHTLHGNVDFVSKQLFVNTADETSLLIHGSVYGLEPTPATFAKLNIKITGDEGSIIPAGTPLQSSQGSIFETQDEQTIPAPITGVEQIDTIDTIADVAQSLAGQYFFLSAPDEDFVVFFKVDGNGSDPSLTGFTSVQVDVSENDTANDNAAALQAIIDSSLKFSASVLTNKVTITRVDTGTVEPSTDFNTGFTFQILTPGIEEVLVEAIAEVLALEAGTASNVEVAEELQFVAAISGVDSEAPVVEVLIEAEDDESLEDFRIRLLQRIQQPPSAGTVFDYERVALSVAGVTRAWVYEDYLGIGTGTVGVTFVEDDEDPIIPGAAKVAEVQTAITDPSFKPVTAKPTAFAPTPLDLDMTVKLKPNTQAVREAATKEVEDLIFRDAAPNGAFKEAEVTHDGVILLSQIQGALANATGVEDFDITVINGGAPADIEPSANGELVQLGVITWQPLA